MLWLVLSAVLLAGCGGDPDGSTEPARTGIPDRTVVLTFDDGIRNHLTWVVPRLEKRGFGATFYVSACGERDPAEFLTWPEVGELHRRGFEVGNHTWTHSPFDDPAWAKRFPRDERLMFRALAAVGVPAPTTFAWPGCSFGPETREQLLTRGYAFARRGMRPEEEPTGSGPAPEIAYDPARHDPLLVPSFEAGPTWTIERYRRILGYARDGRAVVLQFHGIPNPTYPACSVEPEVFEQLLDDLTEGGFHVVAMRDLGRWVNPKPVPSDPLVGRRVPDPDD
jgi:peptidoglycan/xylan/chitin deacetylase (PgdA/CDA1 family)